MNTTSRPNKQIYIQLLVVIAVCIAAYFSYHYTQKSNDELTTHGRYTVGETTGWGKNYRSSHYFIKYTYRVNGSQFTETMQVENLAAYNTSGGKYIVQFLPNKPTISRLVVDMPVVWQPYYVGTDSGWKEVPDYVLHYKKDSSALHN